MDRTDKRWNKTQRTHLKTPSTTYVSGKVWYGIGDTLMDIDQKNHESISTTLQPELTYALNQFNSLIGSSN